MALRSAVYVGKQAKPYTLLSALCKSKTNIPAAHHLRLSGFIPSYPSGSRAGFSCTNRALREALVEPVAPKKEDDEKDSLNWKVKMLYDGDCPLCMREVNMLRERNKQYGTIKFVDISSEDYSPKENQGLDYETVMGRIHAIMSDGTVVTDVQAFRKLYEAVDWGWIYAVTKYEPIATIADAVYGVWAKYRLPITGRPPLKEILESRRKRKVDACDDNSTCKM